MNQETAGYTLQTIGHLPFDSKTLLIGASALALYGLSRRSKTGVALAAAGGVLALRAAKSPSSSMQRTRATFLVNTTPEKAYDLWRNFENLPRFMVHLKSVRVLDDGRSEWVARGPMDREVRWRAEITDNQSNRRIAWQSMPGSDVDTIGSVEFRADPQNRGTFVTANVHYSTPGGSLGKAFITVLGNHPDFTVREDLRRFKALVETGETPTIAGQTHGPRGIHGHTEQVLFRETSNHPQPQASRPVGASA